MIIQCDHCSAKFRIDDAKLANGAVKVRCAKCKEVFVVEGDEATAPAVPLPTVAVPPAAPAAPAEFTNDTCNDSNDFSFDQEPSSGTAAEVPSPADEFDWKGTPVNPDAPASSPTVSAQTFQVQEAAAADNDFDFGDINLQSSPEEAAPPSPPPTQDDFSIDFGEVSFAESPAPVSSIKGSFAETSAEDFSFDPTPQADAPSAPGTDDFLLSFNPDKIDTQAPPSLPAETGDNVNFGDFSFGDMTAEAKTEKPVVPVHLPFPEKEPAPDPYLTAPDEESVPSSLASRKKSGSRFPLFLIFGAIVLVVVLAGAGVYFVSGPKAFSKVGLGFLVDWYGEKKIEDGSIAIRNSDSSYVVNSSAGELFVVRGEAVNNFKKPRASVQVKVSILGAGGVVLASKSAFCGNSLTNEQLVSLPLAKIEDAMNNQFGDSLVNMGLKPGSAIPFVVVMSAVPKEATDFSVQIAGSTVATQ